MTLVFNISRGFVVTLLAAVLAMPALAADQRHRAVAPEPPSGPTVPITGTITDASNGIGIAGAVISIGANQTRSGNSGRYAMDAFSGAPVSVLVYHPGFNSITRTITAVSNGTFNFSLTGKPTVTLKLKNGETHFVDIGTAQFAYQIPFSGYSTSDNGNFCKPDGSAFTPSKLDLVKIIGPATSTTFAPCCPTNPVLTVVAQLKSGESTQLYFTDNCIGNEVDFLGREPSTGQYKYFNFTDINEIDFP